MNRTERLRNYEWCREYLDRLEADDVRLADIARAGRPDGYPSSSMGGSGSPGTISDRTGRVATALADGDIQSAAGKADETFTHLAAALKSLELADKARRAALPLKTLPVSTDLRGCKSHARLKDHQGHPLFEPLVDEEDFAKKFGRQRATIAVQAQLCWTCELWARGHSGEWPSIWLLQRLRDGARLTTKLAEEAEVREQKTKKTA